MTHRSHGLYRILEQPNAYEWLQRALGAHAARQRIVREFLRPFDGARLLDVGCGTGSLLDTLPAGVEYVGYDSNPAYIDVARRKYGERGRFFCARVGSEHEPDPGTFDFVVAKSLLHHLNDEDALGLLQTARRLLRRGGVFFSSDAVRHDGQSIVARILMALDRGGSIRTPDAYRRLICGPFPQAETTLVTDLLPFPYSHFIARATLGDVLHQAP
jgi:SAM-dependent methyltransferase